MLLTISGCAVLKHKINPPDLEFMVEIPFEDGAEAIEVHSKDVEKNRVIGPEEWALIHPHTLHIPYSTWTKIKIFVLDTCNKFQAQCTQEVKSLDDLIFGIDSIVKKIMEAR